MTELLLSSAAAGGLNVERSFKLASELGVDGIELFPFRYTSPDKIEKWSSHYGVQVKGIHFPFWWETKTLRQVMQAESSFKEKYLFQPLWSILVGAGQAQHPSLRLAREYPDAYLLLHADTYHQIPISESSKILRDREVFFENERSKAKYFKELRESEDTHDPYLINSNLVQNLGGFKPNLMFDPRHAQIAQEEGKIEKETIGKMYSELRPRGLHFSFHGNGIHQLPTQEVWNLLRRAIKANPPKYIVLEIGPNKGAELIQARDLIKKDLGL